MKKMYGDRYRLKPTKEQAEKMKHYIDVSTFLYNQLVRNQREARNYHRYWFIEQHFSFILGHIKGFLCLQIFKEILRTKWDKETLSKYRKEIRELKDQCTYYKDRIAYNYIIGDISRDLLNNKKNFIYSIPGSTKQMVGENIAQAMSNYLNPQIKNTGFPTFKKEDDAKSFSIKMDTLMDNHIETIGKKTYINIPIRTKESKKGERSSETLKLEFIKHRPTRNLGVVLTISKWGERYYISFNSFVDEEVKKVNKEKLKNNKIAGIDRNCNNIRYIALSDTHKGKDNYFTKTKNIRGEYVLDELENKELRIKSKHCRKKSGFELKHKYFPFLTRENYFAFIKKLKSEGKLIKNRYKPNKEISFTNVPGIEGNEKKVFSLLKGSVRSKNRIKADKHLMKITQSKVDVRSDRNHWVSHKIANKYDFIVFENLKLKNMTKSAKGDNVIPGKNVKAKSGLNKKMLDTALGSFKEMVSYKAKYQGKEVVVVDPKYTSITCGRPWCRHVSKSNRKPGKPFKCVKCRYTKDSDNNAADNIKIKGKEKLKKG